MTFIFHASRHGRLNLCGHRGHSVAAPENTLAAFRACHAEGGTSCEIDTVLTGDGQIVVLHDLFVDRTSNGTGVVREMTGAEIAVLDAGSWFSPGFAGEPIPTLAQALDLAHELDIGFEVEIKEKVDLEGYIAALCRITDNPANLERMMMISFDHAALKRLKRAIPGIRTGGIVHERFGDPLTVARSAELDQLCIDLSVFDLDDARRLHAAGIAIRCHAYKPDVFDRGVRAGLDWPQTLRTALAEHLIDTLSGDDVAWLRRFVEAAPVPA